MVRSCRKMRSERDEFRETAAARLAAILSHGCVADLKVPLPREARSDRATMERLRDDLLREHPQLRGEPD